MLDKLPFLIIAGLSFLLGLYIYRKPKEIFEIQRKFYLLINWKIEPVSFQKEIRNTKAMGIFLMMFVFVTIVYIWVN